MAAPTNGRHIILVAGARPNFMKIAPVLRELRRRPDLFRWSLVHTGQHYDEKMSGVFFQQLGLPEPDAHLGVGGGTHGQQTGRILEAFEGFLLGCETKPTGVLVVGDVNSTAACAMAAVKLHIPVAHLEAGLRSFDRTMPEEINRLVTDAIADALLVSEPAGEENLRNEGVAPGRIHYVGNVMIDSLMQQLDAASRRNTADEFGVAGKPFGLVTLHRPSNVDDPGRLHALIGALIRIAARIPLVFPAHPRTQQNLAAAGYESLASNIRLTEPLSYLDLLCLQKQAALVITDSGGIQEESSFLGVPCLTLRPNTERPVTTTLGTNTLVTGAPEDMVPYAEAILDGDYRKSQQIPGWDGKASERVLDALDRAWPEL